MADLKAGTTVGGNTIWSQANLPLLPSGNTITYKGFKIYTENDKPTKAEIGLGNVTNDAQVKKAGDDMTGNLTLTNNASLTLPRRINFVSDNSSAVYTVATRSDNNAVTDPFPSSETRVYSLLVNTKSHTSDPAGGATLAAHLFNQKASGAGSMFIQVFGPPNKTTGASGSVTGQLLMNGENGQLQMTGSGLTIGMQTVVSGTIFGTQMSIKGDSNRNLFFQDAGGNELSLIYADTGKNLYVRTGGGAYATRFASDGTLVLANHLTVPGQATFNGLGVFNNRASVGVDYDSQGTNSAILRVDTSGDGNGVGDGVTHLGYKDGNGRYNHYFRGTGSIYLTNKLGTIFTSQSYYNDVPQGTPAQYFLPTVGQGAKNYLRKFRGGNADTIWHETVQGGTYRLATGNTDAQEEFQITSAGNIRARVEVQSSSCGSGGQFRAVQGNFGVMHRNDGGNYYFLITNSGDPWGTWNGLRPFTISLTTGIVSMSSGVNISGGFNINGAAEFNNGLGCGTANGLGANAISLGDTDTGFVQEGDGILNAYANSQRIMRWTTGATANYKQLQVQGVNGPALLLNNTATNQSCYLLITLAGNNGAYFGFGGADDNVSVHNYRLNTTLQLRTSDLYMNRGLYVEGNVNANDVYIRSDIRLKSNLVELKDSLSKIEQLKGYIYDKQSKDADDIVYHRESGLIAQDVEKVLPEAVREDIDTGMLTISPSGINALLVNAINELRERLEAIENKLGA
ncbi:L-shaped tail fiber protein [Cronobacter phage vB_CsaM_leB]|uniref:Long tail fiber protein Gp37 n=2 Tax=Pseudotevenvirus leb TaxID=2844035 RepID=A0A1X8VCE2_9CAUD|nr:long tail fiber protein distal subunit [Cronobacter phage vB_CsaM_leB]AOG16395.1 L-shaped tail fiber protein [Cronobacter phage vB_CsaM_leB]AOG16681.1 large distal tail fiber subunit [Cronobacter phage vB_CsaM_leN]